ncbi:MULTISPECIES: alginate export family protein [unclassified Sphingomonas]|uniref:alginate export family protein n=1 Tax=unclassified Sphingomonas TaxID=196159 RepID=UPI000929D56D|nr:MULTISPECIES: alginate export family protein [unclassified Sphingomonas]OJU19955.1 MAG: hypothetical protein BGN95_21180 [Sphingomonas sp. 66-10]
MPRLLATAVIALVGYAAPVAAQTTEPWQAPTLTITRFDEDWAHLANAEKRAHHWTGKFKYIPISDDIWLSTGIEIRARNENFANNLWGSGPAPDDSYLWLRVMPYADLHVGQFRTFVQPIAAYAIGVRPAASPIDQTRVDLLQGFAELDLGAITLRGGRQMISLGTERLVGTRYGPNVPLAFDGVRTIVSLGKAKVNLFAVNPVVPGPGSFDDKTSPTKMLWGAYAVLPGVDLYYLGYRNRVAHFGGVTGREVRHSIGARLNGAKGNLHWNIEGVAQFGHFAGKTIGAWTVGSEAGVKLAKLPLTPDATLRFNVVSGDGRRDDRHLGTFNALFPKGKYFGELSPVGPTNIISANPRVSARLNRTMSASLAAMGYWRYSTADGVYDIPGNLIRAPGNSRARFIGKEAEVTLSWQATAELGLSTSFSLFQPGTFIRETGPAKTIRLIGLEANFRF